MRERLLQFIELLRRGGVRISIAESLDAADALAVVGFERVRLREALAATLVKDEADREIFDRAFHDFFSFARGDHGSQRPARSRQGMVGSGDGRSEGVARTPNRKPQPEGAAVERLAKEPDPRPAAIEQRAKDDAGGEPAGEESGETERKTSAQPARDDSGAGRGAARLGQLRRAETMPFSGYTQLDYERALDALAPLKRRFRLKLGRRLARARRGRVDFRRTIRAATQHGGTLIELRLQRRRPRHPHLLILADISGSVRYCTSLLLALAAGARPHFASVNTLVFIDRLAEAQFEGGHLVMDPALDLHARSDFGKALGELVTQRRYLLSPATVVVILGDGRNNRRPPRADLLKVVKRMTGAVIWLNPEPVERWGTGDSAIESYAPALTTLIASPNLRELEAALARVLAR